MAKLQTRHTVDVPDEETKQAIRIFNEMADEYDDLRDCWYPFLFHSLDRIISENFRDLPDDSLVLDVGCGTGRQSMVFAELGAKVVGLDIADGLLKVGAMKARRSDRQVEFIRADARKIPFPNRTFDVVNCCGSTLSFIADYDRALAEITRVLKPGGRVIFDVEQKWNLDMVWELISALCGDFLGYEGSVGEAVSHFQLPLRRGYKVDYPFRNLAGETVPMRIRLFSAGEFLASLRKAGVVPTKQYGIHIITNLLPSTVLHRPSAGRFVRGLFGVLARLESPTQGKRPFSSLGNTFVVVGVNRRTEDNRGEP